ncbi:NADP-dependent leukotriene B4 12-hydroxydehydrogenase [Cordyceps javanica]|uniref:Dehydrogenase FUB6 n=1 Tax=Cordyceps javanica TaxID=43265 RepID=A0A545VMC8_9HYPO|nr:NADP-dependent leukotriene B4 12-hydroxydehydrogenase [Cordyceps javanica]TQW02893.1 NADP-dependent leukotriene B4 12-hydroxydehydrogenase [Cordyceps javanica]
MAPNKTFIFKQIPKGVPVPGQDLAVESREIDLETPPKGGLVLEVLEASYDPYLRGRMRESSTKSYAAAFQVGEPITNATLSRVLKSDSPDFKQGDIVRAHTPIAEYARLDDPAKAMAFKIENPHELDLSYFLGPLGMSGLTAWSSLYRIGKPKKGETIFVSSAAGSVGQIVGQIAKHEGLTVIGSVGTDDKLDFITKELGFDAGFNYKKERPADALPRLAPQGIDIYYENVGGEHLAAALDNMNVGGRIPVCGMISGYNQEASERASINNLIQLVAKQILMQGFLVHTPGFGPDYFQEHLEKLSSWLADGTFKSKLHFTEGIDNAAEGFVDMLEGRNFGKAILRIKSPN